jgi:hypothetical protein
MIYMHIYTYIYALRYPHTPTHPLTHTPSHRHSIPPSLLSTEKSEQVNEGVCGGGLRVCVKGCSWECVCTGIELRDFLRLK